MRFDDRIATALRLPAADAAALTAKWRQLVDLLAQQDEVSRRRQEALEFIRSRRDLIDPKVRQRLCSLLAEDVASDLKEAMGIGEGKMPSIPSEGSMPGAEAAGAKIRELLDRLERFQAQRKGHGPSEKPAEQAASFRWECGTDGVVLWVEGAPREALIGQTIASAAVLLGYGVDAQAAGAFKRRAPFRDARLTVAGSGSASGEWRISGVPFFDGKSGAFVGFRGSARRPRVDETATRLAEKETGLFGTGLPPDALRQLVHELRTPLNAILGFSEMIEGQLLGPAGDAYRKRALSIHQQAKKLLTAIDDLDTAARFDAAVAGVGEGQVDTAGLLRRLLDDYAAIAAQRDVQLGVSIDEELPFAAADASSVERMIGRLLATTIGVASKGEHIPISLARHPTVDALLLRIARPSAIAGKSENELLDPGYSPEGDWPDAPVLGLGFALRLVRNIAEAGGGALELTPGEFVLRLPAAANAAARTSEEA